jgi:hypothetical protein
MSGRIYSRKPKTPWKISLEFDANSKVYSFAEINDTAQERMLKLMNLLDIRIGMQEPLLKVKIKYLSDKGEHPGEYFPLDRLPDAGSQVTIPGYCEIVRKV